ncbi:hypothetical protein BaRGS_00033998 [Batillaria attramentaria]|uniref:Uncharacterized protein n=1 Tax=Batillaria attramentaria TaxID=370345 RepID=A0ABD0JJB8_9CAEN
MRAALRVCSQVLTWEKQSAVPCRQQPISSRGFRSCSSSSPKTPGRGDGQCLVRSINSQDAVLVAVNPSGRVLYVGQQVRKFRQTQSFQQGRLVA